MLKRPDSVRVPTQLHTSSGGRRRYIISPEQIKVLRNTETQWKAVANCLCVSPRIICTRSMEYVIADSCDITTEQELESNIKIF